MSLWPSDGTAMCGATAVDDARAHVGHGPGGEAGEAVRVAELAVIDDRDAS